MLDISSVTQLCLTLCDPMDCSTPGFPVHHQHSGCQKVIGGSPCSPVVKNSPASVGYGFDLWSRKIPHVVGNSAYMPQLLSPCSRACAL